MIAPAALPILTGATTYGELVHGPEDGVREVLPLDRLTGLPPAMLERESGERYARRERSSTCETDDLRAWHYDHVQRAGVGA